MNGKGRKMDGYKKVLIIQVEDPEKKLSDTSVQEAEKILKKAKIDYMYVKVPGVLDIAPTIHYAIRAMELKTTDIRFIGYVAVGVARSSFEADESLKSIFGLAREFSIALGTTIGRPGGKKTLSGKTAADDCLHMMGVKKQVGL